METKRKNLKEKKEELLAMLRDTESAFGKIKHVLQPADSKPLAVLDQLKYFEETTLSQFRHIPKNLMKTNPDDSQKAHLSIRLPAVGYDLDHNGMAEANSLS